MGKKSVSLTPPSRQIHQLEQSSALVMLGWTAPDGISRARL
jgi:hypothetical protein